MKLVSVSDKRSDDWFLMNSVWMPVSITAFYLYFVLAFGPRVMRNRPPMQLDTVIKLYNIMQIILCTYITERVSVIVRLFERMPTRVNVFVKPVCSALRVSNREPLEGFS